MYSQSWASAIIFLICDSIEILFLSVVVEARERASSISPRALLEDGGPVQQPVQGAVLLHHRVLGRPAQDGVLVHHHLQGLDVLSQGEAVLGRLDALDLVVVHADDVDVDERLDRVRVLDGLVHGVRRGADLASALAAPRRRAR